MSQQEIPGSKDVPRHAAIATIVLAFSSDPAARWLYRDSQQYLCHFPRFVEAFAGRAFDLGTAYCVGNVSGAALWLPPGIQPDDDAVLAILHETVAQERQAEVFEVFKQMACYHPTEPYWYLPMIGVDPSLQGKGFGSLLLTHALERCDRDRKLAYLESSNSKNLPLYERLGFARIGTIQVGSSPPLFSMVRKPVLEASHLSSDNYPARGAIGSAI